MELIIIISYSTRYDSIIGRIEYFNTNNNNNNNTGYVRVPVFTLILYEMNYKYNIYIFKHF